MATGNAQLLPSAIDRWSGTVPHASQTRHLTHSNVNRSSSRRLGHSSRKLGAVGGAAAQAVCSAWRTASGGRPRYPRGGTGKSRGVAGPEPRPRAAAPGFTATLHTRTSDRWARARPRGSNRPRGWALTMACRPTFPREEGCKCSPLLPSPGPRRGALGAPEQHTAALWLSPQSWAARLHLQATGRARGADAPRRSAPPRPLT